jgi:hypothetical protein
MIAIVSVALLLVVVSPFALRLFSGADSEWQRLSFIGQTYGAVSALIAVVALVGIVGTLVLQARETRRAVEESRRQAMSELLQKAMDDPDLDECWGPIPEPSDPRTRKQQLYINQIISQWGVAYETGAMPERRLRAISREMFSARPGQEFWARAREHRLAVVTEGKKGRFNRILDEEYQGAPRLALSGAREGGEARADFSYSAAMAGAHVPMAEPIDLHDHGPDHGHGAD